MSQSEHETHRSHGESHDASHGAAHDAAHDAGPDARRKMAPLSFASQRIPS